MAKDKFYRKGKLAFWHLVDVKGENECWLWKGSVLQQGYGRIKLKGKTYRAHRLSYELHYGSIPPGKMVCHHCDVRHCVNPNHLYAGTAKTNRQDMIDRNRSVTADDHWTRKHPEKVIKGELHNKAKLKESQVKQIRELFSNGQTRVDLAKVFNVDWSTIDRIVKGKGWTHI